MKRDGCSASSAWLPRNVVSIASGRGATSCPSAIWMRSDAALRPAACNTNAPSCSVTCTLRRARTDSMPVIAAATESIQRDR